MRVVISQKHLSLSRRLANEVNYLVKRFNNKKYLKIESVDNALLERDISVEKKKRLLIKTLHDSIVMAFSIDKKRLSQSAFDAFKERLHNIRRTIIKLRSINYYLETLFVDDLKISKIKNERLKLRQQNTIARDELEALEHIAYKLIEEVVMLDKKLLRGYAIRKKKIVGKEKIEVKDFVLVLKKESVLLEHLEAKLPPPKALSKALMKESMFTHWASRVFALLACIEQLYFKEAIIFTKLKKNKNIKAKINKKISYIVREQSSLLKIMQEREISMKRFKIDKEFKGKLHNLTTVVSI